MAEIERDVTVTLILHDTENPTPEPPDAQKFFAAFGRAIIEWGRFEARFDFLLRICLGWSEAAQIREKQQELLPKSFSRRVKLWNKAFDNIPSLVQHAT